MAGPNEIVREITITEPKTLQVTATANGAYWDPAPAFFGEMFPAINPSPVGFIVGPVAHVVSTFDSGDSLQTGALTYVVSLDAGTYEIGVAVTQALSGYTGLDVSVSIVVGCHTGDSTIQGGE